MQMHACEEPISIYKVRELRVARRAPGVTFLSGTGYIVKTDDSRPRADSPSGTVDCRWSLCKIRRRIITDERQRGAAAAPHDAPRSADPSHPTTTGRAAIPESERRAPATGGLFGNNSESRKPGKYSPNPHAKSRYGFIHSTQNPTTARRERGPRNRRTEHQTRNWQSVSEGPAVQKRLTMLNAFIHPHQHIPQMRCARKTSA